MDTAGVEKLRRYIAGAKRAVFFGGAGMSTESGIPDFRGAHGLYTGAEGRSYEEMLSIGYFERHTDDFWAFYRRVMLYPDAKPNAGHRALARWEARGTLAAVLTQNIDGLHQAAGSRSVLELHGTTLKNSCLRCGKTYDLAYVLGCEGTPKCACGGTLRPDIVFYGEPLDQSVLESAVSAVMDCDLMIVGGTSLTVNPAASLVRYRRRAPLVLINRDATPYDGDADLLLRDNVADVLDAAVE